MPRETCVIGFHDLQQRPHDPVVHLSDIVFLARVRPDDEKQPKTKDNRAHAKATSPIALGEPSCPCLLPKF